MAEKEKVQIKVDRYEANYTLTIIVDGSSWVQGFGGYQITSDSEFRDLGEKIFRLTGKLPKRAKEEWTDAYAISKGMQLVALGNINGRHSI